MIFSFLWPFLQRKAAGRRFAVVWLASPHYPSQDSKHDSRYLLIYFNPRSLCGERSSRATSRFPFWHFNPRSPYGERFSQNRPHSTLKAHFNPRSPHGERCPSVPNKLGYVPFQSAFPSRGAIGRQGTPLTGISIHAPRTGSDAQADMRLTLIHTSIHDPCGGAISRPKPANSSRQFQSTLPVKGAIPPQICTARSSADFNPRSPHGERFEVYQRTEDCITIFQSTLPSRGAIAN